MTGHRGLQAAMGRGAELLQRAHNLARRARVARDDSERLLADSRRFIPPLLCTECGAHLFEVPPASVAPAYCRGCQLRRSGGY